MSYDMDYEINRYDGRAPYQIYGRFDSPDATLLQVLEAFDFLPRYASNEDGDPQDGNVTRARRALTAVQAFAAFEKDPEHQPLLMHVGDLLINLHHLLDIFTNDARITLQNLVDESRRVHYASELREW